MDNIKNDEFTLIKTALVGESGMSILYNSFMLKYK